MSWWSKILARGVQSNSTQPVFDEVKKNPELQIIFDAMIKGINAQDIAIAQYLDNKELKQQQSFWTH